MSNKIIYPALIIIFSILVIYAIINKWNNDKLNKSIESFMNNSTNINPDVKRNLQNNNMVTAKIASGNWTYPNYTVVDANYNASKFMVINASPNKLGDNYGTITIDDDTYKITFLLGMNLVAQKNGNSIHTLHIKFYNIFINETSDNLLNNTGTMDCTVTTYIGNNVSSKFYSYKIEENPVSSQLYSIINTNDYNAQQPPEIYDLEAYSVLMHNYTYSTNYICLSIRFVSFFTFLI